MRRKVVYLLAIIVILLVGVPLAFLYYKGGLKQYSRALSLVNKLPAESRSESRRLLYGNTNGNEYGGIYAGTTNLIKPLVWVWGKRGLKPFATDEFSVFWHLDGCSVRLSPTNSVITRKRDRSIESWSRNVETGDYIMVVVTTERMGGTKGNLREVVGMDWWAFLQKGLEEECKK